MALTLAERQARYRKNRCTAGENGERQLNTFLPSAADEEGNTMGSTAVFFDTEFTNFDTPQLISLGAITIDGKHEFYAEVDPVPEGCSSFVLQHIIPQLTGPAYSKQDVSSHFLAWLSELDDEIELRSDSEYDRDIVYALCGYPLPIPGGALCTWYPLPKTINNNPHHALHDARMLREAFTPFLLA